MALSSSNFNSHHETYVTAIQSIRNPTGGIIHIL
nr:MAG TPA: hypothetical protein [Caudoviricetes sp.]